MQARVIGFRVPPDRLEEVENAYRTTLLPEMETHRGFTSILLLRNADTDEVLELTLWESDDAKRESEEAGGLLEWKANALEAITGSTTTIENYELRLIS